MPTSTLLRRSSAFAILAFCAVMTLLLVRREGIDRSALVVDPNLRLDEPVETWLGFFAGDPELEQRVGAVHLLQTPTVRDGRDGTLLELELDLQLQLFGRTTELGLEGESWAPWRGERREFDFAIRSAGSDFRLSGSIEDDRLRATVRTAGEEIPLDLQLPAGALLQPSLGTAMQFPVLEIGEETVIATFDPVTLGPGRARIRAIRQQQVEVAGERLDVRVYRVETSGFTTEAWVDARGDIVRATTPLGLTLSRVDPTTLESPAPASLRDVELLRQTAVFPTGVQVRRGAEVLIAEVSIEERDATSTPRPGRRASPEESVGDELVDTFEGLDLEDAYQRRLADGNAPAEAGSSPPASSRWRFTTAPEGEPARPQPSHLAADAFVQSDHARVRAVAQEVLADLPGTASDAERAQQLYEWVWRNVDKVPVLGVPSALEVLDTRRGDCNEHTILYTALARAARLPTRIAIGLVWSVDLNGFYYHAWPEVFLGESWHRFDPTLGQQRADATHIKLLEGSLERWPQLLAFLGKLQINVLEVQ